MYKYLTAHETRRWVDICDQLVENYNNTYHSGTKMTPNEASKVENSPVVWYNIYGAYLSSKYGQPKFKVGQTVRISKYKSTFDKGYLPSYSCRSSAGQGKFASQRPTFYHCATPPTVGRA